jgi:anti-sigma factor RsiW
LFAKDCVMNPSFSEDVLSAYLDGELDQPTRVQVETWLAGSTEARAALEELRRISRLIREIPRQTLGEEFSHQVLQLAEKRMLLPVSTPSPVPTRRRSRLWMLSIGGPLTAAALLFVVFSLYGPDLADQSAEKLASSSRSDFTAPTPAERPLPQSAEAAGLSGDGSAEDTKFLAPGGVASPAAGSSALAGKATAAAMDDTDSNASSDPKLRELAEADGVASTDLSMVAEQLARTQQEGEGKLVVIRIHAVDQIEGMRLLRVEFRNQQILASESEEKASVGLRLESKDRQKDQPIDESEVTSKNESLTAPPRSALLIVADGEAIKAALAAALENGKGQLDIDRAGDIELAQLDEAMRGEALSLEKGLERGLAKGVESDREMGLEKEGGDSAADPKKKKDQAADRRAGGEPRAKKRSDKTPQLSARAAPGRNEAPARQQGSQAVINITDGFSRQLTQLGVQDNEAAKEESADSPSRPLGRAPPDRTTNAKQQSPSRRRSVSQADKNSDIPQDRALVHVLIVVEKESE